MDKNVNEKTELSAFVESALVKNYSKIFRVNVNTGKYEVFKNDGLLDSDGLDGISDIYAYMNKLITDEIIYPEYAAACQRFTNPEYVRKSVFSGENRIVQSYRRRTDEGDKWITFAVISGHNCGPENPMVLFAWRKSDPETLTLLDTIPTISSLYDMLIRINLSNNTYEPVIVDTDEQEWLIGGATNMYEWWAAYSKDGNIATEDKSAFDMFTETGSLQKHFGEDHTPISFRYCRKKNNEFRWVQLEIVPSIEYSEENQVILLSIRDVHEEYTAQLRSRQELINNMTRDALTKLFNRLKFNEDIENFEKSSDPLFTCLYIDVNGLHELNNRLGHQKGDDMLCCVADTLSKYFPDEGVYRIGGDEFVVLSINLTKGAAENNIEKVCRDLLRDNYEISVGIATGACGENVEKIVAQAELEMRNNKANYYMHKGDRRKERRMNEELEQMLAEKRNNERYLNIIAHQFTAVYFVDIVNDTTRHIYAHNFFSELLEETDACFSAAMRLYVEKCVKPEYYDYFDDVLDYDKLDEKLSETGAVQFTYQKTDGTYINVRILEVDRRKGEKPGTIWIIAKEPQ